MKRIAAGLCVWALGCVPATAGDMCLGFEGMWAPVYDRTYEEYPDMRQYMDGPSPSPDSFIRGLVEGRRIVIDCARQSIQSIQGAVEAEPRGFNIDSATGDEMVINFIAERFINPESDLEREMGKHLRETAPRVTFTFDGEYLKMSSPHESFVMRRARAVGKE